ncbi:unnamed protein product [Sphenostylis stenocarpa]|uniref:Phenolic glucoside malonyltransferase 1-like n=1 Tax=Sphenostylis stenocarpa TaxID=92480 RepID=A0AA86SP52_9FABA|nr:unnamed protein product [Sphenostylis stenocarpa]
MEQLTSVKVLQVCTVTPSQGATTNSSTPTSLPLTCYDIIWLRLPPVKRLFFYELPNPTISFFDSILPNLKNSLSLTLQHFLPLAGTIIWPLDSPHPIINYVPGNAVSLTIAESNSDFNILCSNTCETSQQHPLTPQLANSHEKASVIALQVTFFPSSGFSLGIVAHHAAMDGRASTFFLKAWAYVCSNNLKESSLLSLPKHLTPFYDRSMIRDTTGIGATYLKDWQGGSNNRSVKLFDFGGSVSTELIRGSFELTSSNIQKLKEHAEPMLKENARLSTFLVTFAYVLPCLIKAEQPKTNGVALVFSADLRSRLSPPIASTYFGNCISGLKVINETKKLLGDDGFINVLKGLKEALNRLEDGCLSVAEPLSENRQILRDKKLLAISGSPRFEVYSIDFGWGRPKKVDIPSIGKSGTISFSESRNENGGVEIGLVLDKQEMEAFTTHFTEGLESL